MGRINTYILLVFISCQTTLCAQNNITGQILDGRTKTPVENAILVFNSEKEIKVDKAAYFKIVTKASGEFILEIIANDYVSKKILVDVQNNDINLGTLFLEPDIRTELTDNLITLTDEELSDEEVISNSSGLLQATRDIFLTKAAFDFGQAFFRVRGYDSQNGEVSINGIPMNKFADGRPQWNNWGGLNDMTRNQSYTNSLSKSDVTFGGILGNTSIDMRPTGLRPGTRVSASSSNRTYTSRLMVTHTSKTAKGFTYSISGSRRWAKEGYSDGTLYDSYSFAASTSYQINDTHSISVVGILARNRRGKSSAITEEVFNLMGGKYNPYWGGQNGKIRNSRERLVSEPFVILNYDVTTENLNWKTGLAYQKGVHKKSRLGYYNAPNPDPTYYRYLPSYYINSKIGANFLSANSAKEAFLQQPQLDWNLVYSANSQEKAAYNLYDDVTADEQFTLNSVVNYNRANLQANGGLTFTSLQSKNYAQIKSLFGASFHEDVDTFSNTKNNSEGNLRVIENDIFNYNYTLNANAVTSFVQAQYDFNKWKLNLAAKYGVTNYKRTGLFKNERYVEDSFGDSEPVYFKAFSLKNTVQYKITNRHWVVLGSGLLQQPVTLQNTFINPRENNKIVSDLRNEKIQTIEVNYHLRLPKIIGRISAFYTRFMHTTDVNFFFTDTGLGSDFVQEVVTNVDKLHRGVELGLSYQVSSAVKLVLAANFGDYTYASNPNVNINFDVSDDSDDLISTTGFKDLGVANLKGYKLAQGPQTAVAIGVEYRDPKYWWLSATTNYLTNNYANISAITRTQSFYLNPDDGLPFSDATPENVHALLKQKPLDEIYFLNLVGGKSWLKNGKYISAFLSINNLFNTQYRTGGYEQSRNGNYGQMKQDNLSGTPSFAPKYWYGYGRTYFLNFAYSF